MNILVMPFEEPRANQANDMMMCIIVVAGYKQRQAKFFLWIKKLLVILDPEWPISL